MTEVLTVPVTGRAIVNAYRGVDRVVAHPGGAQAYATGRSLAGSLRPTPENSSQRA